MINKVVGILCVVVYLSGCIGEASLDTSSREAYRASLSLIKSGLSQAEKRQFTKDLRTVKIKYTQKNKRYGNKKYRSADDVSADGWRAMDGLTAKKIRLEADKYRDEFRCAMSPAEC